jgi:flagellar hook-associated protein 3 FlgL
MTPFISGASQQYLTDLANTQAQMQQAQAQVSSGYRLQEASDDPSAIADIYQLQTTLAQNQQTQTNLGNVQSGLSSADTALQSAVSQIQTAISLATQGASTTTTPDEMANLATQVSQIMQSLVGVANTNVNGSYIFSGDQNTQPSYQVDASQPEGVQQLLTTTSTSVIQDVNGTAIAVGKTASEIFDPQDPTTGGPATGNTFAAVNSLLTALQNDDPAGAAQAATSLQNASDYLNQQLAFYGDAENSVTNATNIAQQFQTQEQSSLSQVQDADIPTAALALTQAQTQEQATLSVAAKIEQTPTLFSYLG